MPTPQQLKLLHVAARQVGLITGKQDDARYRLLLANVAGVDSSKSLSQAQFEDVMAVMEDMGFSRERVLHQERASFTGTSGSATRAVSTYWRDKVAGRGRIANARMIHKIRELSEKCPRYTLSALALRFSDRRTSAVEELKGKEAWDLIEMLKAAGGRDARPAEHEEADSVGCPCWSPGGIEEMTLFPL